MRISLWRRSVVPLAGLGLLGTSGSAPAAWGLNMPKGVTEISNTVHDLHMFVIWICVAIGVVVFGVMFYSILMHRKSKGVEAAQFHESTSVEIAWTIVPFLILVGMAIPATKTLIAMETTGDADMTVQITGYQWKWKYDYLEDGISFLSVLSTPRDQIENKEKKGEHYLLEVDRPLIVPVNKKIRFVITSNDVIHSWWVPDLAVKKDAIPGFINEAWTRIEEPGTYRGQCTELCGRDHGFMPVVVVALEEDKYQAWMDKQKSARDAALAASGKDWPMSALMAKGEQVYAANCAACHQPDGKGVPGTFPPIKGSPVAKGEKGGHIDIVMKGRPNTMMAGFAPQLKDDELAAVITYQRNAFGNDTGDVVQPSDIKAAR